MVRRDLFSTFITRGLPVIAQSEIFLLKGVSFYPSISPFTMKGCEGYACKNLMLTNGEEGKSLRIARRRKYFVWDGYKRPRFFSIYYEGICRTCMQTLPVFQRKEHVMSKRRSKPAIVQWLSARSDNRESRFIQVGNSLVLSHEFQDLGIGTRYLYLCMAMESGGKRDFTFPQKTAEKYGIKPSSLWRHIKELEAGKFIKVYSGKPTREPNKYEFCPQWKRS